MINKQFMKLTDKLRYLLTDSIYTPMIYVMSLIAGFVVIGLIILPKRSFPITERTEITEKVQQGYVIPSKLEIITQDLDKNGQKEVLMQYDGKNYLLTLDNQGNPRVQDYEVKPAEVVPKQ